MVGWVLCAKRVDCADAKKRAHLKCALSVDCYTEPPIARVETFGLTAQRAGHYATTQDSGCTENARAEQQQRGWFRNGGRGRRAVKRRLTGGTLGVLNIRCEVVSVRVGDQIQVRDVRGTRDDVEYERSLIPCARTIVVEVVSECAE